MSEEVQDLMDMKIAANNDTEEKIETETKKDSSIFDGLQIINVIYYSLLHIAAIYGVYVALFRAKLATQIWLPIFAALMGSGVTLGSHRYFSHKSYEVTTPVKIVLLIMQTMTGQNSAFTWAREHRLHHKYSDTDADPHNAARGFFFSHMGWLLTKKHPLVLQKGRTVDVSDLLSDKLIMFQHKYYIPLYVFWGVLVPIMIPIYLWDEKPWVSFFTVYCLRYVVVLHFTWSVNSVAHLFGNKPYDKRIYPVESALVSWITFGEGTHNYHHAFPWDYRVSEFSTLISLTTRIIDLLAYFDLTYDRKTASQQVVHGHLKRHGDGTH
ncbi:delta(9)-fatty-acid desaturase fat-6, partial [Cephus cinctus]|uniref:Delta(9)-fatty-acid desaturase fat-6 n=1 Tax=Cephus cinctus TaxID=211228 RepID=A0AAJ7CEU4_CEPCN